MAVPCSNIMNYDSAICWNIGLILTGTRSISSDFYTPLLLKNRSNRSFSDQPINQQEIASASSSETTRANSKADENFAYWLAGLIDGDGYFGVSKSGYASCEITLKEREANLLYKIRSILGGSVKQRTDKRGERKAFR